MFSELEAIEVEVAVWKRSVWAAASNRILRGRKSSMIINFAVLVRFFCEKCRFVLKCVSQD